MKKIIITVIALNVVLTMFSACKNSNNPTSVVNSPISVPTIHVTGWKAIGVTGFTSSDYGDMQLDVFEGSPYVAFSDVDAANRVSVIKYELNDWGLVGLPGFNGFQADNIKLKMPYIAFRDISSAQGRVMKYNGSNWENVGAEWFSTGSVFYICLEIDGGIPYVAFEDNANSYKATVKKFDGLNWVNVGNPGFSVGRIVYPALQVYNGAPYLAFRDVGKDNELCVMKYNGADWVYLANTGISGEFTDSIDIQIYNGTLYLKCRYYDGDYKTIVKRYDGNQWLSVGSVNTLSNIYGGTLHMPYISFSNGDFMKFNGSDWQEYDSESLPIPWNSRVSFVFYNSIPFVAYRSLSASAVSVMKYE